MATWLALATDPRAVRRVLRYAVCVGAILITISPHDAILRGDLPAGSLVRMLLTVRVPYVISALPSVEARRATHHGESAKLG